MNSANGRAHQQIDGVVEARNERGVRIDGDWHNVSQYHPVQLPDVGAQVRLEVDAKGFIRELEVLSEPAAPAAGRDERIARLAVLKAAASFAAERADIRSGDVLRIADSWLKWVLE